MSILGKSALYLLIFFAIIFVLMLAILQFPQFGSSPEGARLERVKKSQNYRNGIFENFDRTTLMTKDASYWKMIKLQFSKIEGKEPTHPIPAIKADLKRPTGGKPTFTWFGHSSYLIQVDGKNILVDPVFSERSSPFNFIGPKRFPGSDIYSPGNLPFIDYTVITHDHYDHLDYHAIVKIKSFSKKFITSLGVGAHLEGWGVDNKDIIELDWWENKTLEHGFKIVATPARHFSGRGILDRNKTLWSSFVLYTPNFKIFIGGDSGYGEHFKLIGEKHGPFDIALLECGQYYKYWPQIHMIPEETVRASLDLQAKVLLPVHWGKFSLSFHTWTEPVERALKEAGKLGVNITTPMIGERVILNEKLPQTTWWRRDSL